MHLSRVPDHVAHAGLRALYTVCIADGELSPLEQSFLRGVQEHVLHSHVDLATLSPITLDELARAIAPGEHRARVLTGAVIAACIDGRATDDEVDVIEQLATALELDPAPVRTARRLAKQQLFLARIDIARRALAGHKVRQTVREEGALAMIAQLMPMMGVADRALAARYRALASSPAGTLGRGYFDFVESNGFSFPGEPGAGPEIIVVHDCLHVLGDYGTSPEQEIEVASFQAGCHGGDPLYGLLFGIAQYHLGVQVAPVAPAESMNADPERMMHAFARGCLVKRDMWSDFRPWEHFAKPLDALRDELNVVPA
ncbi:TerB family tellurite resistance protein [Sandaracinus amylolyticus]|uniref:TerB family tellurite resistance protein n=1 Tax=Sandaracinus amylolyticus TaxID=927083 RepID=UPI001F2F2BCD|nr:TerB family tellurite resistance protein [Sandaracinus amylolyticus]UJR84458.1 Hypothetical protein I5071_65370 [Sandaracinus amylolyticus]